jgi:serine/threonine protein kinase
MSEEAVAAAPGNSLIGTRVGNYEIRSKIGEGGMGAVYLGEHPLIGKKVAIKVLLEELVSNENIATRFFNEAKAANDIRHQNIVDIVDFGKIAKEGGGFVVYIIMELLEGESLSARVQRLPPTLAETQHILGQCCSGLAASHAKGIIHRDLKPDNLFLVRRGGDGNFVKILDFGIAKLTASATNNQKTRTGTLIGTPAYMSPEQCAGRGKIDARSDIYSLGIVMYEMLTGRVPFVGEGFGDIVVAHITEAPKPPSTIRPDLPPEIEKVVMRAIEKDPDRRFQSMEEFGVALANPTAYAMSPQAVAMAGLVASAPTTALPSVNPEPSGAHPMPQPVTPSSQATTVHSKRPNTTLSGAASEVREPAGKGRRLAVIGTSAAVGVAALALVMFRGAHDVTPTPAAVPLPAAQPVTPTPTPAPPPAAPKPPAMVELSVTTDPPGAQVTRSDSGDAPVGVTPLVIKVAQGSPDLVVGFKLDGYKAETRTIKTDVARDVEVALTKESKRKRASTPGETKPQGDEDHKLLAPEL